jgi:DNA-binding NtrC family response regulator
LCTYRVELVQPVVPASLEFACDGAVLGLDGRAVPLGPLRFVLCLLDASWYDPGESVRHQRPGRDERETAEDCGQKRVDESRHALIVLFGRVHGNRTSFALGSHSIQLGRETADDHHIQIDDLLVSRHHAELHWSAVHRRYWIRDLDSRNGVYLNGIRVARETVSCGDVLRLGNTVFRLAAVEPCAFDAEEAAALPPPFIGRSRSLHRSLALATRVGALPVPVVILGPTGTGKELVAAAIHRASHRTGPFVPVNCAALPANLAESELFGHERGAFSGSDGCRAGLFRAAHTGTLFLDEVGELAPEIQAKLLRGLETRSIRPVGGVAEIPIDVRILAATNRDLASEVAHGRYRADLYARLTESVIQLDPLRDRPEDLEPLWHHFVDQLAHGATLELTGTAFEAMALYPWPLNVRELRQLVRSALLEKPGGGQLGVDDLPSAMRRPRVGPTAPTEPPGWPLLGSGEVPTTQQLRRLVEEFHGNVTDIAAFLGKDRKQIYRWLRREHIDPNAYRSGPGRPQC